MKKRVAAWLLVCIHICLFIFPAYAAPPKGKHEPYNHSSGPEILKGRNIVRYMQWQTKDGTSKYSKQGKQGLYWNIPCGKKKSHTLEDRGCGYFCMAVAAQWLGIATENPSLAPHKQLPAIYGEKHPLPSWNTGMVPYIFYAFAKENNIIYKSDATTRGSVEQDLKQNWAAVILHPPGHHCIAIDISSEKVNGEYLVRVIDSCTTHMRNDTDIPVYAYVEDPQTKQFRFEKLANRKNAWEKVTTNGAIGDGYGDGYLEGGGDYWIPLSKAIAYAEYAFVGGPRNHLSSFDFQESDKQTSVIISLRAAQQKQALAVVSFESLDGKEKPVQMSQVIDLLPGLKQVVIPFTGALRPKRFTAYRCDVRLQIIQDKDRLSKHTEHKYKTYYHNSPNAPYPTRNWSVSQRENMKPGTMEWILTADRPIASAELTLIPFIMASTDSVTLNAPREFDPLKPTAIPEIKPDPLLSLHQIYKVSTVYDPQKADHTIKLVVTDPKVLYANMPLVCTITLNDGQTDYSCTLESDTRILQKNTLGEQTAMNGDLLLWFDLAPHVKANSVQIECKTSSKCKLFNCDKVDGQHYHFVVPHTEDFASAGTTIMWRPAIQVNGQMFYGPERTIATAPYQPTAETAIKNAADTLDGNQVQQLLTKLFQGGRQVRKGRFSFTISPDEKYARLDASTECLDGQDLMLPQTIEGAQLMCIADNVFEGQEPKSISIPDGVLTVGTLAGLGGGFDPSFYTKITVPGSVCYIAGLPNIRCGSIQLLENNKYLDIDGLLIHRPSGTLLCYLGSSDSVIVPNEVRTVSAGAFESSGIVSISFQSGLKNVEKGAFSWCECLESICFPSTLEHIEAGSIVACGHMGGVIALTIPRKLMSDVDRLFETCEATPQVTYID